MHRLPRSPQQQQHSPDARVAAVTRPAAVTLRVFLRTLRVELISLGFQPLFVLRFLCNRPLELFDFQLQIPAEAFTAISTVRVLRNVRVCTSACSSCWLLRGDAGAHLEESSGKLSRTA